MSLISLVSVIARAGEYKNYSRDEIKYWRYTSYKGGKLPEGFTDEKFSSAIYNGRIFTMKRLHTLMLFLAVLFTGFNFNAEAATVKQALSCNPEAWAEQPGACPSTYELYEGDATYKAAIDKALKPVGLSGMFGKGGYQMLPGYFRFVCQNGCVCGQSLGEVRVPHRGNVVEKVIEGAYEVVEGHSGSMLRIWRRYASGSIPFRRQVPAFPATSRNLSAEAGIRGKNALPGHG